jgi:hypothetical protein
MRALSEPPRARMRPPGEGETNEAKIPDVVPSEGEGSPFAPSEPNRHRRAGAETPPPGGRRDDRSYFSRARSCSS